MPLLLHPILALLLLVQGYGLVQFEEAEAVEKALAMDGTSMVSMQSRSATDCGR